MLIFVRTNLEIIFKAGILLGLMVAASGVRLKEMNNLLFTHVFAIFAVILFRIVCLMHYLQYSQTLTL